MAKLYLRRFSTLENYQNADIEDGTFFVIEETSQLGVMKGRVPILTPLRTLEGYEIPEGEVVITQNNTISEAIAILAKRTNEYADKAKEALDEANRAVNLIRDFEYTEV